MTLLTSVFAAVICTVIWYRTAPESPMKTELLCFMYWGASLMWFVDAVFEYAQIKGEYFTPAPADMLNDFYLGLSAVAFGLVIWLAVLFAKDPKSVVKAAFLKNKTVR